MPRIMCTRTLWRRLGHTRPPKETQEPLLHGVTLGNWAAKVFRDQNGRELVLAVDERTFLAIVFPLVPRQHFRQNFADALGAMLDDLAIPPRTVAAEADAIAFEPLGHLADAALTATLADLQYICEIELMYHDDLRVVQFNLNDFPHAGLDPCVSKEAVAALFAHASDRRKTTSH